MQKGFEQMCEMVGRYGGNHCFMSVFLRQDKPSAYKFTWFEDPGFQEQSITAQSMEALIELISRWHTIHMFAEPGSGPAPDGKLPPLKETGVSYL